MSNVSKAVSYTVAMSWHLRSSRRWVRLPTFQDTLKMEAEVSCETLEQSIRHSIPKASNISLKQRLYFGCPNYVISPDFDYFFFFRSCCSHLDHRASVKRFVSLQFLNLRQSVRLLGQGISPSLGRYIIQIRDKRRHPCLEWDSKPRSQCSSEGSCLILRDHCDGHSHLTNYFFI
jgi:hypothetical protein